MIKHTRASLAAQMVKNPPGGAGDAETQVRSRGREDPLEKGMATPLQCSCLENPMAEEPGGLQSLGSQSQTLLSN